MSLLSRLFGRSGSAKPPKVEPAAPAPAPARPDPNLTARAEEAQVTQAIDAGDMTEVARWVREGSSTRVRQSAAQAIVASDQLDQLIPAVRGKDKNVYRILLAKREELLAARRAVEQKQAEIAEAVAALTRHGERAWDASYAATLARLEARWNVVATEATPQQQEEVGRHVARAHATIEAQRLAHAAEAERQRTAALAAEQARRERDHATQVAAEAAAAQAQLVEAERQAEQARHDAEDAQVRELIGLLRQAQAALEHGGTARAVRLRDSIQQKLPQAPALPAWFARKLQDVDARIQELQDWRTFTVVPKRAEVVQRMEALVGAEMSPEELARQIRRLREEWRTLHRGAADEVTPEHERFERAAEQAYEPCREYFARQAELRRANQAQREAILDRLDAFIASQSAEGVQADGRALQQVIAEARQEWRQYAPVDENVVKPLQARFHAALDSLRARVDAEHADNAQAKRELIARAATLVAMSDTRAAIDQAKSLQRDWKSIGPATRHQDETLWAEFRGHCDAVFERSSQERAAQAAGLEASRARAVALCEEVERLSGLPGEEFDAAARGLAALRDEFDALDMPRAVARDLRQRFARAIDHCEQVADRLRRATERRGWDAVFAAHGEVRAYALCMAQGGPAAECEALRASAAATVAALEQAPKAARGVLEQQLAAGAAASFDLAANERALRELCVQAELAAGAESPPEDLELRREVQMRRLVASMGRGERPGQGEFEDLALAWLRVGAVEPSVHDGLFARFERARA